MTKPLSPLRRKDIEAGRKLERMQVAKWLRDGAKLLSVPEARTSVVMFANAIEQGAHAHD